jgi:hypothetical protein
MFLYSILSFTSYACEKSHTHLPYNFVSEVEDESKHDGVNSGNSVFLSSSRKTDKDSRDEKEEENSNVQRTNKAHLYIYTNI